MSSNVIVINDSQFETEILKSEKLVLAYFWATWCGPCRLMSPLVEKVATEYSDRLKVVKMEVDPKSEIVKQYQVEGVPAFRLFQNQKLLLSDEGAMTKQQLIDKLEPYFI
ncbi:co-chaperone YbbN [Okeania sp. SIO2B3]|uniref:thioredoxin family protein n=1 Tax=Okeania sp. SIO2B3 TaxID=2607784 RepID=UPI0013C00FDD|nr:thioredoxin family protein [Okeania sp. SIO2B3]NET42432.1 thioredoxin [Okeania sp. SIO2B3]